MNGGAAQLSVLVVGDSEDAAQSLAELLTLYGHAVRVAACGDDALRAAEAETPDVVLLDIGRPGTDGWTLAERIRDRIRGKQPVMIAVTGYDSDGARLRSADAGIDLHLVKPADPVALNRLLAWVPENLSERASPTTLVGERI